MDKKLRDRLVGGFGGGGGALVLYPIIGYVMHPNVVTKLLSLWLTIELIGIVLVSFAVYFYFKKVP